MVNKVILVGNVGKDPDVKTVGDNVKVASFSLATSESFKDKNGEKQTNTTWHNCQVWRGLADVVEKYVKKGSALYVEGKIQHRAVEKDGETKYYTSIVISNLQMLGSKASSGSQTTHDPTKADIPPETKSGVVETDDLPFN